MHKKSTMLEYMHSRESAQKEESISHHGNRFKEIESIDQKKTSWCFSKENITPKWVDNRKYG